VSSPVIAVVSGPRGPAVTNEDIEPLFRAHYARLVRSLALACGDRELAADAVQEAFVRAHTRWSSIRGYEDPLGWVRRVAINLLHDAHRRAGRKRRAVDRLAAESTSVAAPHEPDDLDALLASLPPSSAPRSPSTTSMSSRSPRSRRRWSSPRAP